MKLVLEISYNDAVEYRVCESFPVTLGRGFDNTVILADPYVSARHLVLGYDGALCTIADAGSINGFTVDGRAPQDGQVAVAPGAVVSIGYTEIRIYPPEHPVPEAVPFHRTGPFFQWIARPAVAYACFALTLAAVLGHTYLLVWGGKDTLSGALLGAAVLTLVLALSYARFWANRGRLERNKGCFREHAALFCLAVTGGILTYYIDAYASFLIDNLWIAQAPLVLLYFAISIGLFYGSFTLATRLPRNRRLLASCGRALVLPVLIAGIWLASRNATLQDPILSHDLRPYFSELASATDIDGFMQDSAEVFASDVLKK